MNKKKVILIVEDEKPLRAALTDMLQMEGFSVLNASNGKEGLQVAEEAEPNLIVIDLFMPLMDGMTMLKQIRSRSKWGEKVPTIILTNLSPDDDQRLREVSETNPAYYLVKADTPLSKVARKVKQVLNKVVK